MRFTIVTVGKRGDVQPFVALGRAMQATGHSVTLAANDTCGAFIRENGLDLFQIAGNPIVDVAWSGKTIKGSIDPASLQPGRTALISMSNRLRQKAAGNPVYEQRMREHLSDCLKACQGSDAVIFSLPGFFGGFSVAEKLGIPAFPAYTDPIHPTGDFPHPLIPGVRLGSVSNKLTYSFIRRVFWQLHGSAANRARKDVLNLPPVGSGGPYADLDRSRSHVLYAYSPAVLPKPADWAPWVHVTGYWFLDHPAAWQPSPKLLDFLRSGPAPVFAGFGSVHVPPGGWDRQSAPDRLTSTIVQSLVRSKQRGIVLSSGGAYEGREKLPDCIFETDPVPFDWLFPRVSATIHHGGAGTAAAAFRAGVPSVVVPFTAFQPFWGRRVQELGVGPAPIAPAKVSVDNLTEAITAAVTSKAIRNRSQLLGEKVRSENGTDRALEVLLSAVPSRAAAGA